MTRKYITGTPYERVMKQVVQDGDCLIYTGRTNERGYGRVGIEGGKRNLFAHRIVLEHHYGPSDLEARHLCHRPSSVNIDHLAYGTHHENVEDGIEAGCYDKKTTKDQREAMCQMRKAGFTFKRIAEIFDVGETTVKYHVECGR